MRSVVTSKVCKKCGEDKPLDEYYKSATCRDGHIGACKVCKIEYQAQYHKDNPDVNKRSTKKQRASQKYQDRYAKWKEANREKFKAYSKKWRDLHPHKKRADTARHRANKKRATPAWFNSKEVNEIYKLASERGLEVDHMVPIRSELVCGLHVQDNLRCIPAELNNYKGNRYWPDMWK